MMVTLGHPVTPDDVDLETYTNDCYGCGRDFDLPGPDDLDHILCFAHPWECTARVLILSRQARDQQRDHGHFTDLPPTIRALVLEQTRIQASRWVGVRC